MSTHSRVMSPSSTLKPAQPYPGRDIPHMRAFPGMTTANLERMEAHSWTTVLRTRLTILRSHAKDTRQEVDDYLAPVFAQFTLTVNPEFQRPGSPPGQRITCAQDLYLTNLDAPEVAAYFKACDQAHQAHGYHLYPGECPALMAEAAVVRAEDAVLDHGERFLGCPFREARLDLREQALAILMRPVGGER